MVRIQTFTFNPFEENTYVLYDETSEAVVVDPGCYEREEKEELSDFISTQKLIVKLLLNTHCHIDHVLGNDFVKTKFKVPFLVHAFEVPQLRAVKSYASNYGFPAYQEALPDGNIQEENNILFGKTTIQVLFLPGHSPGSVGFYLKNEKMIVGGDVLFYHSIGRTDLPGGNTKTLLDSIRQNLFSLPDDITVYPGHGSTTTLGEEKVHNPFCALSTR